MAKRRSFPLPQWTEVKCFRSCHKEWAETFSVLRILPSSKYIVLFAWESEHPETPENYAQKHVKDPSIICGSLLALRGFGISGLPQGFEGICLRYS